MQPVDVLPTICLGDALDYYDKALTALENAAKEIDGSNRSSLEHLILDVLTCRDTVESSLSRASRVSSEHLVRLQKLDQRLKQSMPLIKTFPLGQWRSLVKSPEDNWWWYPDPPALFPWLEQRHAWLDSLDWLWTFFSLFFLTFAVTVVLDTLNRVAGEGLNTEGMFPVVVQVLLTVAGGSATLTKGGRDLLRAGIARLRIPKHFWQEFSAIASLIVLLIVLGIHSLYLPRLAASRYDAGKQYYSMGEFDSAQEAFEQALALQPNLVKVHYDLGLLYEDLQQTDKATGQYERLMSSDPTDIAPITWLRAHNNLGRLYILDGEYRRAWVPLERALNTQQVDLNSAELQQERYNLLKNMSWMWLSLERYREADEVSTAAIIQNPERSAAYCLKAQVLEGLEQPEGAIAFWKDCLRGERRILPEEAEWAAIARERLEERRP